MAKFHYYVTEFQWPLLSSSRIVFQTKSINFSIFPLLFLLFSTFSSRLSMFSWFRSRREKRGTSDRSQQLVFLEVRWPIEKEKKAVCIILKNKPRRARPCTSAFYHCPFFYFEMKFDYWHAQELILENWLDRIWIVCCNSWNTVVFMVRGLINIILFNNFFLNAFAILFAKMCFRKIMIAFRYFF